MNNEPISASVNELSTALKYLESEPPHQIDNFSVLFRFFKATEQMLFELCEKSGGIPEKRITLGKLVYTLSQRNVISTAQRRKLETIVQTRNMAAHARPSDLPDLSNVLEIKDRVVELFRWYLTECKFGPNLSVDKTSDIIDKGSILRDQPQPIPKKVFMCYAKEDYKIVERIYEKLLKRGHKPWMDKGSLLPGQDWEYEITQSIKASDFFIACMSNSSVTKRGYVQKEVRFALDVLGEIPQGQIFLIPLRLEPCEVPSNLRFLHWLDLNSDEDYLKLFESIEIN